MNPAQYIKAYKEFSQISPPAKILLYGDAELLKDGLMQSFKKTIEGMEDFALEVFWMTELKGKDAHKVVFDSLLSLPMLSDKRVVILRNFDITRSTERKILSGLNEFAFPDSAIFVVESSKLDMRHKESKQISKMFRTVELATPNEKEMSEWITYFARRAGKRITISAVRELISLAGISLSTIREEINKMANYVDENTIQVSHIREVAAQSRSAHIFQFANAVQMLDLTKAMKLAMELMDFGEQHSVILSWMNRSLTDLLWAKIDPAGLPKRMGRRAFLARKITPVSRKLDRNALLETISSLHSADMMVKKYSVDGRTAVVWALSQAKELLY